MEQRKETKNTKESPDADDSQGPPITVGPSRPGPPRPGPSPPTEKPLGQGPPRPITYDDDEEEDLPLHQRRAQAQQQTKLQPAKSTGKASLAYQKTVGGKLKLKNVNMKGKGTPKQSLTASELLKERSGKKSDRYCMYTQKD